MFQKKKKKSTTIIRRPITAIKDLDTALKFRIEESYKAIRTNLVFSIMKKGCKKIIFTSSRPAEGKTSTTVNLAITLAAADNNVLLIDADLRKPKVHQYFGLHVAPGLTNYLGSMVGNAQPMALSSVIQKTDFPNLSVFTAGSCPATPAELLASEPMQALLDELAQEFDYILLDTPPINVVSDALPLIKQSDGVVAIVRANSSVYQEVDKMVQSLKFIEANILGFVLTAVEEDSKSDSYYDYSYVDRRRSRSSAPKRERASSSVQRQPAAAPNVRRTAAPRTGQAVPPVTVQRGETAPRQARSANGGFTDSAATQSKSTDSYIDISSFDVQPRKK